jgi:hypothetical protein
VCLGVVWAMFCLLMAAFSRRSGCVLRFSPGNLIGVFLEYRICVCVFLVVSSLLIPVYANSFESIYTYRLQILIARQKKMNETYLSLVRLTLFSSGSECIYVYWSVF